jgi:FHS family L-fucose permease-like MFS transporter
MAYLWAPILFSGPVVKKFGYRLAFLLGLTLIAGGSFLFSFAAQKKSFGLLATGMHLSGIGVSTLERAANPYVVNVGPLPSRTTRILFAQSMAGVGTVVAPLVAKVILYDGETVATPESVADLTKTITLYRLVGFVTFGVVALFTIIFYRTKVVPEIPVEASPATQHGWRFWKHPVLRMQYSRLWTGVFCNFFNMACQVS